MSILEVGEALAALAILLWGIHAARSWGAADTPSYDDGSTTKYTRIEPIVSAGPCVLLTAYVLDDINRVRRSFGGRMLSAAGFSSAIGLMASWPLARPVTRISWVTYLILFETNDRRAEEMGFTWRGKNSHSIYIDPSKPYNGQPYYGEFGGRPSHWHWNSSTPARVMACEILRRADPTFPKSLGD